MGKHILQGILSLSKKMAFPLMKRYRKLADEGKTPLIFTDETEALGIIAVADTIRNTSKAAIQEFKQKVFMLLC